MRRAEIGVALFLMLIGFLVLADAIRLGFGWGMSGPKAGFFPFYMALGIVICGSIVLFKGIQKFKKEGPGKRLIREGGLKPILWVLLPSTFMVIATGLVGLHMAALLFLVFYMRVIGKINWTIVIPVSVIVPLTIYTLFEKVFLIPLPSGLFGDKFMPF